MMHDTCFEQCFRFKMLHSSTFKKYMSATNSDQSLVKEWLAGGLANAITSAILNPMDVAKTRLQIQQKTNNAKFSISHTIKEMYQEEGLIGLWKPGLYPSMIREMVCFS